MPSVTDYGQLLTRAGVPPGDPVHALLLEAHLDRQEIRDLIERGIPLVSDGGEAEIVFRLTDAVERLIWFRGVFALIMLAGSAATGALLALIVERLP